MEGTWAQCGEEYVGLVENAKVVAMLATMEEKIGSMEEGMREEESESFLFYEQEVLLRECMQGSTEHGVCRWGGCVQRSRSCRGTIPSWRRLWRS